jgi:hypothetical protein
MDRDGRVAQRLASMRQLFREGSRLDKALRLTKEQLEELQLLQAQNGSASADQDTRIARCQDELGASNEAVDSLCHRKLSRVYYE